MCRCENWWNRVGFGTACDMGFLVKRFVFFLKNSGIHEKMEGFRVNLRGYPTIFKYEYNFLLLKIIPYFIPSKK